MKINKTMIKVTRNILILSAVLAAAAGCTKDPEVNTVDAPITLKATEAGTTKALLDNGTFKTTSDTKALIESEDDFSKDGNRIQVYAYANGGYYFSDMIGPDVTGSPAAEATDGVWPFVNGPHNWTSGTHRFYGWLTKDANSNLGPESLFGNSFSCVTANKSVTVAAFNTDTQTLTIPTTTMSPTASQFDFMYSNIFTTEPINSPVQLEFSHLFAAYYFSFTNNSPEPLELESVRLNVKSSASANINYSGAAPSVNVAFQGSQPAIEKVYNSSVGSGKTIDVLLTGNEITSSTEIPASSYRIIWPQDLVDATVDIAFTAKVSIPYYRYKADGGPYNVYSAEEVAGGAYTWNGTYYVYAGKGKGTHNVLFQHDARGVYEEVIPEATAQEVSRSISLASVTRGGEWIGGQKYNYNLSFSNDDVDMQLVVMRWDGGHGGNITFE